MYKREEQGILPIPYPSSNSITVEISLHKSGSRPIERIIDTSESAFEIKISIMRLSDNAYLRGY
jgi:hypothetical protein